MRRLAGNDPEVNEEWITDKDRFAFTYARAEDRITYPQVRDEDGDLRPASWSEAFAVAARGLVAAGDSAVLTGGRLTAEDAYAYAKFARVALGTNDVDFRSRPHSAEEADFLAAAVALSGEVTYADLDTARSVVLIGLEPEDEAGTIFLRLRKAHRATRTPIWSVGAVPTRGLAKLGGTLIPAAPGEEAQVIADLAHNGDVAIDAGGVILVGERMAGVPGALDRRRCRWPGRPAPSWPGSRGGPATAARSRRAACPTCCPAAVRSPTPLPGSTSPPRGARAACRRRSAATATPSSRRWPRVSSVDWSSGASTPTTPPTLPGSERPWRRRPSWSRSSFARPT